MNTNNCRLRGPETFRYNYKVTEPRSGGGGSQDLNRSLAAFKAQEKLKGYSTPCQESPLKVMSVCQRKGITLDGCQGGEYVLQIKEPTSSHCFSRYYNRYVYMYVCICIYTYIHT